MSRPEGERTVRAVYVPATGEAPGVARLEVTARAPEGDWTLTVYPTGPRPPRRLPLTPEALRAVVREWGRRVRRGRGTLRLG